MSKSQLPGSFSSQRRWTAAHAQKVLAALASSKLSVAEFAAREGLDANRLYLWRNRLKNARVETAGRPRFVEVPRHTVDRARVEIVLRSGRLVRVDESIDVATLRRLVDALEQEPAC